MPNISVCRPDVAQFFQPSIDCIVKAVLEQKNSASRTISVSLYMSFFKYRFPTIFCVFSISCSWADLLRATGYSPKYMKYLISLDLTSFVLKTTCECSSRSVLQGQNDTTIQKNLHQKQSCLGWRDLILPQPLENSRFRNHKWPLLRQLI